MCGVSEAAVRNFGCDGGKPQLSAFARPPDVEADVIGPSCYAPHSCSLRGSDAESSMVAPCQPIRTRTLLSASRSGIAVSVLLIQQFLR